MELHVYKCIYILYMFRDWGLGVSKDTGIGHGGKKKRETEREGKMSKPGVLE